LIQDRFEQKVEERHEVLKTLLEKEAPKLTLWNLAWDKIKMQESVAVSDFVDPEL
jgi:hypothetical protein